MKKIIFITLISIVTALSVNAQILHPVHWSYGYKKSRENKAVLFIKATIDESWHIYSCKQADGGPVKTSFDFISSKDYRILGTVGEPKPITKFETTFNMNVSYFENSVVFRQKVDLKTAHPVIKGKLKYMVCNDQKCLPPEEVGFSIPIK